MGKTTHNSKDPSTPAKANRFSKETIASRTKKQAALSASPASGKITLLIYIDLMFNLNNTLFS